MGVRLYQDNTDMDELRDEILLEGYSYIADLSDFSENEKKYWIERERLGKFIQYIPNNSFAKLKFINVVGNVNLFGRTLDVRSPKFYDGLNGNEQFKSMVADLNDISSKLTLSHTGVSSVKREVDRDSFNPSDLERFDYLFQFTFNFPAGNNLETLINQVLSSPNKKTISFDEIVSISKSKNISKKFLQQLGKTQEFVRIHQGHSLYDSALVKKIQATSGRHLLPVNVPNIKKKESSDTAENRFIKFFLEEIKSICLRLQQSVKDSLLRDKIYELKGKIDSFLFLPFFKEIGRLQYLPDSSSVLLNKAGYRELYYHFVQSKFGFVSLVKKIEQNSMMSGLKDMAALYEIWVFFELGKRIFGEQIITQEFSTKTINNGDILRGVSWSSDRVELKYNYTFSRSNNSSYSLRLRPDISLKVGDILYLFDAKYKFTSLKTKVNDEDEEIQRIIKSQDIHKMHAYLDAIEGAKFSVAIYPGDTFVFYNRPNKSVAKVISEVSFNGVGAIPLLPNSTSEELEEFIIQLKKTI